jgi:hypothetical protein
VDNYNKIFLDNIWIIKNLLYLCTINLNKKNMTNYILTEGPLNDNELLLADENKVFKGNYIAIIKEYKFLNEWSNKLEIKRFRSFEQLEKHLNKFYPEFTY